ncbi:MAG: aspartate-semialdehyde dehydrogenase [Candidatus Saccharimonadales bacterium]
MGYGRHELGVNVGIVGATGAVGGVILEELAERRVPVNDLRLFASSDSAGTPIGWNGSTYLVEDTYNASFRGLDYVLLSAGGDATKTMVSMDICPRVAEDGAIAIDNSSAWRGDPDVPLVVAEINPQDLDEIPKGIVANPNCTTMTGAVVFGPLHEEAGLRSINVSTYQSVSGQGQEGIDELVDQLELMLEDPQSFVTGRIDPAHLPSPGVFPEIIGFNVAPSAGSFIDRDTSEELKFVNESRKILGLPRLAVSATCVRVPVLNGHSMKMSLGFDHPISPERAEEILSEAPGVSLVDVPQPINASGEDAVHAGRIRRDPTIENGLEVFVSGDNLKKGAALNAVQILEIVIVLDALVLANRKPY